MGDVQVVGEGVVITGGGQDMAGPFLPGEPSFLGDYNPALLGEVARPDASQGRKFLVVIDAGHGGKHNGALGVTGTREKDLVLGVAQTVARRLEREARVEVLMTREQDQDVALWDRVSMANRAGADLFISIHANAFFDRKASGVETFFHALDASDEEARRVASAENEPAGGAEEQFEDDLDFILADMQRAERLRDSSRFAHLVQAELAGVLPMENKGVMQADFIVLRGTRMPSVLLELGFMTNRHDEQVLKKKETHQAAADAIVRAVAAYQEITSRKQAWQSKVPSAQ